MRKVSVGMTWFVANSGTDILALAFDSWACDSCVCWETGCKSLMRLWRRQAEVELGTPRARISLTVERHSEDQAQFFPLLEANRTADIVLVRVQGGLPQDSAPARIPSVDALPTHGPAQCPFPPGRLGSTSNRFANDGQGFDTDETANVKDGGDGYAGIVMVKSVEKMSVYLKAELGREGHEGWWCGVVERHVGGSGVRRRACRASPGHRQDSKTVSLIWVGVRGMRQLWRKWRRKT